jgi:CheY-like chemotaxis protein
MQAMTEQASARRRILFIEDSTADLLLFRFILKSNGVENVDLQVVTRGDEAIQIINSLSTAPENERPDLVVLDLNLPCESGLDVLKRLRRHASLEALPVVVMTGSTNLADRQAAAACGVSAYLVKSSDLSQAIALGKTIKRVLTGPATR